MRGHRRNRVAVQRFRMRFYRALPEMVPDQDPVSRWKRFRAPPRPNGPPAGPELPLAVLPFTSSVLSCTLSNCDTAPGHLHRQDFGARVGDGPRNALLSA